ncbi:MAG TPA: hypothetical protein VGD74_07530 [Vulgatibacter sp.]
MRKPVSLLVPAALLLALAACGTSEEEVDPPGSERCGSNEYLAFDPVNHEPQDQRLAAFDEMLVLFGEAQADPARAEAKAQEILAIYERPSLKLSEKVAGRTDVHDPDAPLGAEMDAAFRSALEMLKDAGTATEVSVAKQRMEKAGIYRFLYHSVLQELWEPTRKHYDEAYGYLGTGETNAPAGRKGLARLAGKRDESNGTTIAGELFLHVLDGACALEKALDERGADEMAVDDDPAYLEVAQTIDRKLRKVIAYSIGHELIGLGKSGADVDGALVKLEEAEGYFVILERGLARGAAAEKDFAQAMRAALDDAFAAEDEGWIAAFPAADLKASLEAAFGIHVHE